MNGSNDVTEKEPPTALRLILEAIVRHGLSVAATALATHGVLSPGDHTYEVLIGSAGAIVMLGWSFAQKLQHSQYVLDLEAAAKVRVMRAITGSKNAATLLAIALTVGAALAGCGSAPANQAPIVFAVNGEHIAVTAVHAVVQTEAQAFRSGAYDNAKHQTYVAALLKIVQSEKVLNDALRTWNAASGQPMPQIVSLAVQNLQQIIADVTPLIPASSSVASLVASANAAVAALTGGK